MTKLNVKNKIEHTLLLKSIECLKYLAPHQRLPSLP